MQRNSRPRPRRAGVACRAAIIVAIVVVIVLAGCIWRTPAPQIITTTKNVDPIQVSDTFVPSLKWEKQWWLEPSFTLPQPKSTDSCPLCNYTATQLDPSSSESDVVVTVAMGEIWGLPTTIRSMRTAGIKSALVVLADTKAAKEINKSIQQLIDSCGVTVVDVGTLDEHQMKGRYRTRWHLVYDYFRLNPMKYKRFAMTDAYDSFFQGDVFLGSVKEDTLYFSTESITVGKCMHNSGWIREVWPKLDVKNEAIICAGPVVGGVEPLLKLCEMMLGLPEWKSHWVTPPDQAYVNYVVRSGLLTNASVKYEVVPNDGFITTVGYCDRKGELVKDANGNIGCPGFKTIPMLLHQYVRPRNMRGHMYAACPAQGIKWSFKTDPYSKASF